MQFESSLQALGFSILLLHSIVAPEWAVYRILNRKWIRQIGVWSYSIYIWQQLFWRPPSFWGLNHVWWMGLWIVPLSAVTLLSYYGLEQPFFKLRNRYREVKLREAG
jgi:peptidoglycan/LPS O-acetylase OafA/YrhL